VPTRPVAPVRIRCILEVFLKLREKSDFDADIAFTQGLKSATLSPDRQLPFVSMVACQNSAPIPSD